MAGLNRRAGYATVHLSAVLKFIRGARGYYVPFFFWLSRKNGRTTEKNYSGGNIFRAYSRLPSQKFVSPYHRIGIITEVPLLYNLYE